MELGKLQQINEMLKPGNDISVAQLREVMHNVERTLAAQNNPGFDICVERTLGHEGKYVNNPNDPGGETNWGISKRSYPNVDIVNLTRDGAVEIYRNDFWNAINANRLPGSVVFQLFDFAVNSGCTTAIRSLQKAIGAAPDGHWGPISQARADGLSEGDLILGLIAERIDFMRATSVWPQFSKGWMGRITADMRLAMRDNAS